MDRGSIPKDASLDAAGPKRVRLGPLRRILRSLLWVVGGMSCVVAWWFAVKFSQGNFAEVQPNRVYRCAQVDAKTLKRFIREYGIKTVLNLRGEHPDTSWYRDEREATLSSGANLIDIALSSSEWLSRKQAMALVETLDTCQYPILIHCWRGAERTGLVSACCQLLNRDATFADAESEFSWRHMYFPYGDGVTTAKHIELYKQWLEEKGLKHSPMIFRDWIQFEYRPRHPSREDWPYDPYPIRVVTRPDGTRIE
jgi:protein tyrosine phosphatase (PTP) superfamily phosphohydrolase (DUF442 family)